MFFIFLLLSVGQLAPGVQKKSKVNSGYLERRPYVQYVTKTALSILWETPTTQKNSLTLKAVKGTDKWEFDSGPRKHHEIRFKGLVPRTKYQYELKTKDSLWRGVVSTAPDEDTPFTFLVIGDNRYGHAAHRSVISAMTLEPASFFINTGDMVDDGFVRKNWYRFFKIEHPLMKKIPLWPIAGNHENTFGNGLRLYRRYFALPENGPQKELTYTFTWGNSRFFILNSNKSFIGSVQASWLREQLANTVLDTKIKHLFVLVHQSPYTSGPHGPNKDLLQSGLVDDMRKFGVDLIFAGHDHIYERGRVDGLNYIISGGGGAPIYYIRSNKKYSIVTEPTYHYCRLYINGGTLEYTAHRADGSLLDYFTIQKKSNKNSKAEFKVLKEHKKIRKKPIKPIKIQDPEEYESKKPIKNSVEPPKTIKKESKNRPWIKYILISLFSLLILFGGAMVFYKFRIKK